MPKQKNKLINLKIPPTLKEMAFQSIKDAIISKVLEPGEVYSEQRLAEELAISKTPVREALLDLASKGFLTIIPRRGVRINTLTKKEIQDLYLFRTVLEKGIIPIIMTHLDDMTIQRIEEINDKERDAIERNDTLECLKLNRKFHMAISLLTNNDYIVSALENIYDLIDWAGSKALLHQEYMKQYNEQHKRIIRMLKKRDSEGTQKMIEEHVQITANIIFGDFQ